MTKHNLSLFLILISSLAAVAAGSGEGGALRDLWIHPRNDAYDPVRHYRAPGGELYYETENDIAEGFDSIVVQGGSEPRISAELGPDVWIFVERNSGSLRPVIHYDSNGDGKVDKTIRGRIEGNEAIFDSPSIADVDFRNGYWQLGIVYKSSVGGVNEFDGRYLASIDSNEAKVSYPRVEELARVDAGPAAGSAGLVIFKHKEGAAFDFADFARRPEAYLDDFIPLTRAEDADDWTIVDERGAEETGELEGSLRTHFDREDLFLVRIDGDEDLNLDLVWGDMPVLEFLETQLVVRPDRDGCYSTLESEVKGDDDEHRALPHRILYCPQDSMALFDVPDGYQIFISAVREDQTAPYEADEEERKVVLETVEASTSILDNIRLYAKQIYPRSPRRRATGSVGSNIAVGFVDAGSDVVDIGRHAVTGEYRTSVNTGQRHYRPSLVVAIPLFFWRLGHLQPLRALTELFDGAHSTVQIAADAVSAISNAVVNPMIQGTVGLMGSPGAADTTGHWFGAVSQAWAQNLPLSERSADALSPFALYYHDRAFAKTSYTRTDTQLNIDRILTAANIVATTFIIMDATSGGGSNNNSSSSSPSSQGSGPPPAAPPGPVVTPPPPVIVSTPPVVTPPPVYCL